MTGFVLYPAWEEIIRHAVLRNFFAAIDANELEVRILSKGALLADLNRSTLEGHLARAAEEQRKEDPEKCRQELGAALGFLRALRSPANGQPFTKTIKGVGELRLYVHRDTNDAELPDLWGYMRKPHMLVGM